ncbi:MAG: type II toxin-antitoxin system VapC family toxin [Planctomycetes bacterium]|nr:type II toxin-antitoxin system VapC family toxin [Planctomycetota bacterium]
MKVLLDTCVISEIRRPKGSPQVRARVDQLADADLFLSVITIGEVAKGTALLKAGKKKQSLEQWLSEVEQHYSTRILPVDSETAEIWGQITAKAQKRGHVIPVSEGLIAATAIRHGIHVMTRNTDHFAKAGALLVDPWENG